MTALATIPRPFAPAVLRRALLIFVPAALLIGAIVLGLYELDLTNEHTLHEQAAAHLVDLHSEILTRELRAVESDVLYLANQDILRDFVSGGPTSKRKLEEEYVLFCRHKGIYDQIRYLNDEGQERIRINLNHGSPAAVAEKDLQPKAKRYYFTQTMELGRGQVFVSPFDLNVEYDKIELPLKPVIRFATPVFGRDGTKRGIVILNYLGDALLAKLAEASVAFPGSAWLLNRDGYFLRGPSARDEWGFMLGHQRKLATYYPDEWQRIADRERGQFFSASGSFTFRTIRLGARQPAPSTHSDPDARDARLIVVAHVPARILDGRAQALLRRLLLLSGVLLVVVLGLAWYLGYAGALRREHERQLAESEGRLRTLSAQLMTAQEEERRSIARDLHDEMGQVVTAMTLDLQRAAASSEDGKKADLIHRALTGAARLLDTIHEIAARVRPSLLDDLGLKDAVQSYLSDFEHRTGLPVSADLQMETNDVPAVVSENIYRILQEALTNASKHSHATTVSVMLRVSAEQAILTVRDDGRGFDPSTVDGRRFGLLGMRERAELLHGTFQVKSTIGKGTEISVVIPLA
jgi:signal transduction histidine kinase